MRILALCLLTIFSAVVHAGELKIYTSGGLQGVEDDQGRVVVPAIYEKLGWSDGRAEIKNQTIGFFENGYWGLINIKTRKVGSARYKVLEPFNEELLEAGKITHYSNVVKRGLINEKGEAVVGFNYYTIDDLGGDRYKVSEYTDGDLKFGMLSSKKQIISVQYESLEKLGDLVIVSNIAHKKRVFALDGTLLVTPWIDAITKVSDGYIIQNEGYVGKLSNTGLMTLPLEYKKIQGDEAVSFPSWSITDVDNLSLSGDVFDILCDSITLEPEHHLLIAHVNNAEHILAASDLLFTDQQNSLRSIKNGFLVTKNRKSQQWGIYKTDGREVAAGFDSVAVDSLYFYTSSRGDWDVYNMFGRRINERPFQEVSYASMRNVPVKKNDYWGWIDFRGNVLLNYTYEKVGKSFDVRQFVAKNYGKWGVSDFEGNWLVEPEYDSLFFYDKFYVGERGMASYIINAAGEVLHALPFKTKSGNFLELVDEGQVGAITSQGHYIHPQYDDISMHGQYYEMLDSAGATMIHSNGREVLKTEDQVQDVLKFSEGYFHIIKDGKHGFVDENGKLRIANRYDSAQYYNEGLAPVKLLGKWGFIDKNEILKIQPFYKYSSTFQNGLAIIQTGENFGVITPAGNEIVEVRWKYISRFATGNYRIVDWDGKVGICDMNGKFIIRPNYTDVADTNQELLIVSKNGQKGLMDYQGYTKLPFEYADIQIKGDYLLLQKSPD